MNDQQMFSATPDPEFVAAAGLDTRPKMTIEDRPDADLASQLFE